MRRSDLLLVAAVVLGMSLALLGLIDDGRAPLDEATAARVNGTSLAADELQSLLQRRAEQGAPVDRLVATLDDMIDEELLIQRASELGILRRDSNVRVAIVQAMEKAIFNEERSRIVSEEELEAFYRDHPDLFTEPLSVRVEELLVSDPNILERVSLALSEGESLDALAAVHAAASLVRVPPVPLSLEALNRRYPAELVVEVETAARGDVLRYESSRGTHLLRVIARLDEEILAFEEVRMAVLNELQLERQERAYADYLLWLRQRADIRVNEQLAP